MEKGLIYYEYRGSDKFSYNLISAYIRDEFAYFEKANGGTFSIVHIPSGLIVKSNFKTLASAKTEITKMISTGRIEEFYKKLELDFIQERITAFREAIMKVDAEYFERMEKE